MFKRIVKPTSVFRRLGAASENIKTLVETPKLGRLVLARHGETEFNIKEIWAGLYNTELTPNGERQAVDLGIILRENDLIPDVVITTPLNRARDTTKLALTTMEIGAEVIEMPALLELHPGALIGTKKTPENKRFIKEWYTRPPAMDLEHPYHPQNNKGTIGMPTNGLGSESLEDVAIRTREAFEEIMQMIRNGEDILIVGHSNHLSAFISHMTRIKEKNSIKNAEPKEVFFDIVNGELVFSRMDVLSLTTKLVPSTEIISPKAKLLNNSKEKVGAEID